MRCLREIQNVVFELLYRDRIKINNSQYEDLYTVHEEDGQFVLLRYRKDRCSFNYREIEIGDRYYNDIYNNIYKISGLHMKLTRYKTPENY